MRDTPHRMNGKRQPLHVLLLMLAALTMATGMTRGPKSYQPLTTPSHFEFVEDVLVANKVSAGLAKGRYQAVFEGPEHVYYLGEPKALIMPNGVRVNGGIALPKPGATVGCHLFIQIGDDSKAVRDAGMGVVISALARMEAGRIREFKKDSACGGFMPHIAVVAE
ncbi:hypothetical protein [Lysobacter olei]